MESNAYRGESEVTIPAEFLDIKDESKKNIVLKMRFTHSSYLELEKLTGIKHFVRLNNTALMLGEDFMVFAIYAGTRRTRPEITIRQINEWLDAVPPSKLPQVYTDVQKAFMISLMGPPKEGVECRGQINKRLDDVNSKKLESILEFLKSPEFDKPEGEDAETPLDPTEKTTANGS